MLVFRHSDQCRVAGQVEQKTETQPWLPALWITKSIVHLTDFSQKEKQIGEANALNLKSRLIEMGHHTGTERHLGPTGCMAASTQAGET